jgi:divalent metal cation (Fe/Co/Zn/Cd) transporter
VRAGVLKAEDRSGLRRRGRNLEYLTSGWNSLEAVVAIAAGLIAGSIALVGFGVDSIIETSSGVVLLWRLHDGKEGVEALRGETCCDGDDCH